MKRSILFAGTILCVSVFTFGQDSASTQSGTTTKPKRAVVEADAGTIRSAQDELKSRGYMAGPSDGVMGPNTSAAVTEFQADEGLPQTGRLDASTLQHLHVGGTDILGAVPTDVKRTGKAVANDVKAGEPIDAGKAIGHGSVNTGKKIGKGTEALAGKTVDKVHSGMDVLSEKIYGTTGEPNEKKKTPSQNTDQNQPVGQQPSTTTTPPQNNPK